MFFEPRRRPLELAPQRVLALRPSLNTPVISVADLPVGPACAAILVHMEPGHGLQINVGVRSLGCGSVTVFGFDRSISADVVNVALDAALSFAESMGFLFDDDMVDDSAGSQEKAVLRWGEMIGEALAIRAQGVLARGEAGALAENSSGDELQGFLEPDAYDLFEVDSGELTDPPEPEVSELPVEPEPAVALSKFRIEVPPAEAAAAEVGAEARGPIPSEPSRRALGRVRLVKRAGRQRPQDTRRAWLLRFFTSF